MKQISVTECAAILGVTRTYIKRLCASGRLKAVKVGATWAIPAPPVIQPSKRKVGGQPK